MSVVPFVEPIIRIVERLIPDPDERASLEHELRQAAITADAEFAKAQSEVIQKEAAGSWMQRSWRPILMFLLMGVILWHMIAVPMISAFTGISIGEMVGLAVVPTPVWTLLTVGMGGYIGGRTVEKVMGAAK